MFGFFETCEFDFEEWRYIESSREVVVVTPSHQELSRYYRGIKLE